MAIIVFFLISLTSASLLFVVQPMAAKSALPILGGAPFVWNGCMVFFQALVLAGYLYAYILSRALPVRRQPILHISLFAFALLAFPLSFAGSGHISPAQHPICWLMSMLAMSVGLPFFILSATSPLSQRWFAASDHALAHNPYVLYSASNLGSFIGLLAYPVIIEPNFSLREQADLLHYGFIVLLALFTCGAFFPMFNRASVTATMPIATGHPPARLVVQWIILSFIPASLLYGLTSYITTDIASVPLFWVIPLAIYLLTFVLVFGRHPPSQARWRMLHLILAPAMAFMALMPLTYPPIFLLFHLMAFFAAAIVCHGKLSETKPSPEHLTAFFLWLSLGGVLGGIFNTFIAPYIFVDIVEYPLMLLASVAVTGTILWPRIRYLGKVIVLWAIYSAAVWWLGSHISYLSFGGQSGESARAMVRVIMATGGILLIASGYLRLKHEPMRYALWVAPMMLVTTPLFVHVQGESVAFAGRNVFGVSRVIWREEANAWVFQHGTTYHGIQSAEAGNRLQPTSYYGVPLGEVYRALPEALGNAPVGVIGMGVGTVACYGHSGQEFDFFEINPMVDRIAHDTRYFTYLKDCAPTIHVVIGDGRINLGPSPPGYYGLIIMDAFSSDAIPMHLLTREAITGYVQKLRRGGLIAFNISNRYINLLPVLSAIAKDTGMAGAWMIHIPPPSDKLLFRSEWVVLAENDKSLTALFAENKAWQKLPKADSHFLWRDDYSNILRSILEK